MSDSNAGKYAPVAGKIPGYPINLGGREFILAPLGLRAAREAGERGRALPQEGDPAALEQAAVALNVWMVQQSLVRNYPDITIEDVEDLLDVSSTQEAIEAITGQSGLKRQVPAGEMPARS